MNSQTQIHNEKTIMIQSYTKYKRFKSLVDAKENEKAVRSGLDFLRFVAEEYSRLEVYNNQECDGDDFFTYQVEKELALVLRDEATPIESVAAAQKEMAEIEKMEGTVRSCIKPPILPVLGKNQAAFRLQCPTCFSLFVPSAFPAAFPVPVFLPFPLP